MPPDDPEDQNDNRSTDQFVRYRVVMPVQVGFEHSICQEPLVQIQFTRRKQEQANRNMPDPPKGVLWRKNQKSDTAIGKQQERRQLNAAALVIQTREIAISCQVHRQNKDGYGKSADGEPSEFLCQATH